MESADSRFGPTVARICPHVGTTIEHHTSAHLFCGDRDLLQHLFFMHGRRGGSTRDGVVVGFPVDCLLLPYALHHGVFRV